MNLGSRKRIGLGWAAGCLLAMSLARADGSVPSRQYLPLFNTLDNTRLLAYWASPSRYVISNPPSAPSKGAWQVRMSVEGSLWLWNLAKGRKTAASLMGGISVAPSDNQLWSDWICKKVRHDRWVALAAARASNAAAGLQGMPLADRETPDREPEGAGPIPQSLLDAAGVPPLFAQAVQPHQYSVAFDDVTIRYEDCVKLSNPRYAYLRSLDGVSSAGAAMKDVPQDRMERILGMAGCDASKSKVLKAVSQLEGGFDAVNTYDTGFVSVGFIQFASLKDGSGALGAMLQLFKLTDPSGFDQDFHHFGIEVQPDGTLDVLDPATGVELYGPEANAKIIHDKRLVAVFQRAGQLSDSYCAVQVKAALAQYYPCDDHLCVTTFKGDTLSGKVGDVIRSEAGMATLFDRKVNTGNINALPKIVNQVALAHRCQSLADLARYEREIVDELKYRSDFTQNPNLSQPTGSR